MRTFFELNNMQKIMLLTRNFEESLTIFTENNSYKSKTSLPKEDEILNCLVMFYVLFSLRAKDICINYPIIVVISCILYTKGTDIRRKIN